MFELSFLVPSLITQLDNPSLLVLVTWHLKLVLNVVK